jgi:hypothetical protein
MEMRKNDRHFGRNGSINGLGFQLMLKTSFEDSVFSGPYTVKERKKIEFPELRIKHVNQSGCPVL